MVAVCSGWFSAMGLVLLSVARGLICQVDAVDGGLQVVRQLVERRVVALEQSRDLARVHGLPAIGPALQALEVGDQRRFVEDEGVGGHGCVAF